MSNSKFDEMREEYDFSDKEGVRGKYFEAMQKGFKTIIRNEDGSTVIRETRAIFLDPEVQEHFPNSTSVNKALRELINAESKA